MTWHPVVAGVDASQAGALAAAVAWMIARSARTTCHLVHGARGLSGVSPALPLPADHEEIATHVAAAARQRVEAALRGNAPPEVIAHLDVRFGHPAWVLGRAIEELQAGLLVLGGKHHAPPVRWFGGSTAHHAVRTVDVPTLVAAALPKRWSRVLVAIDLSEAARPTLEAALRFAEPFDAQVRALHVVEPLPLIPDVGIQLDEQAHIRLAEDGFQDVVSGLPPSAGIERLVRHGSPARTIREVAAEWNADLVVLGSHGKGWVDRVLLGSTTERLLNRLPTSVLVIPMGAPKGDR